MMTNEERLLHALYGIKKVLNDFGLEDIKNEVQLKDGNSETIDCISVLQEFVVNYVNSTQAYKFEDEKENYIKSEDLIKMMNDKSTELSLILSNHDAVNREFISGIIAGFEHVTSMMQELKKEG